MGRTKVRASGHVAGWRVFDCPDVSRRHAKVHHCLARRDRIARAMGRAARRFSPRSRLHTQVHRDRRDRRRGGRRRLTRWRGARAGHHLRDIIGSAIRPNRALAKIKAGVCRRAREMPNGRLLVDSPSDWDHNLGLRAQSRPLRMMPTLRTLATALCLLGLVATGIVGGCGLGPTAAQARPTPP